MIKLVLLLLLAAAGTQCDRPIAHNIAMAGVNAARSFLQRQAFSSYPLPDSYRSFTNINLVHAHSAEQKGGSCGWYVLSNALAINKHLAKGMGLDAGGLAKTVESVVMPSIRKNKAALCRQMPNSTFMDSIYHNEVAPLAKCLGVQNYTVLLLKPKKKWMSYPANTVPNYLNPYINRGKYTNCFSVKSPSQFLKKIIGRNKVTHFYLSVPTECDAQTGHAVLASVILPEQSEGKPDVIFMDSNNLRIGSKDTWLMDAVLYQFFKAVNDAFA